MGGASAGRESMGAASARRESRHGWLAGILILGLLASCSGTLGLTVEGTVTPEGISTPAAPPTEALPPAPASSPSPVPKDAIAPPPGLVYRLADGLYQVDAGGHPGRLIDRPDAAVSPDGSRAVYQGADGIWLADLKTGQRRNLTQGLAQEACCPRWWPARADVVLLTVRNPQSEPGPGLLGFPAAVGVFGGDCRALDSQHDAGPGLPAPSPDGQTIAYGGGEAGWLFHWDRGIEPFDPAAYGLTGSKGVHIGSPAWSPDGRFLAWVARGFFDSGLKVGIAVFDLEKRTCRLLHPYESAGSGAWPGAPAWSPDGQWLAFFAQDKAADQAGLWVVRNPGPQEEEYHLAATGVAWSPDGRRLAIGNAGAPGETGIRVSEVPAWQWQRVDLPPEAELAGWTTPALGAVAALPPGTPQGGLAGATATYTDTEIGYTLTYPAEWHIQATPGWTVILTSFDPEAVTPHGGVGPDQAKIDLLPDKALGSRSLEELVRAARGGGQVLREEAWGLAGGVPAARMQVVDEMGAEASLLLTVINGRSLRLVGYGDLGLFDAVARTLQQIPGTAPAGGAPPGS